MNILQPSQADRHQTRQAVLQQVREGLPLIGTTWAQQAYFDGFEEAVARFQALLNKLEKEES